MADGATAGTRLWQLGELGELGEKSCVERMSKKSRAQKQRAKASSSVSAAATSTAASSSDATAAQVPISKAAKRRAQKKRAKATAVEARAAEAAAESKSPPAPKPKPQSSQPAPSVPHPEPEPLAFAADEEDHCETAPEAYADISPLLRLLAAELGRPAEALRIYDPYYCNGAAARHLGALGFPLVHNANEDFYEVLAGGALPAHDVLLTTPPYSGHHPESLLRHCAQSGKPWLALMPNWVCGKPFYEAAVRSGGAGGTGGAPCYIVPRKRYHYWTPRGRRRDVAAGGQKAKTHGHTNASLGARTSPFVSFWYGGGFPSAVRAQLAARLAQDRVRFVVSRDQLPPGVRP